MPTTTELPTHSRGSAAEPAEAGLADVGLADVGLAVAEPGPAEDTLPEGALPEEGRRRRAVAARDPAADGTFVYSVRTTGVYCHPSCAARPARPENLAFHDDGAAAERAGFRPCKRCRPDLAPRAVRHAALVAEVCRRIEAAPEVPTLSALAEGAGLSPQHLHRLFKSVTGVTPRAYGDAHRQRRARDELERGAGVTEALYNAGFSSSGRFYEAAPDMLGMTPSAYRGGGAGEQIWAATAPCSLGWALVAATGRGVCAILLGDSADDVEAELGTRFPRARIAAPPPEVAAWVDEVVRFADRPHAGLDLPLDIRGTAFQRRVWEELRAIPAGRTATYSEVARRVGRPGAARAVAGACAANPLALAIPCHRVVAADGSLAGYRWGLERKARLLAREQR